MSLFSFRIGAWMADVACPVVCQLIWPACWLDTPDWSSSSSTRVVQDVRDVYRDELGVVLKGGAVFWSSVDDFWSIWSMNAKAGFFRAYSKAGGLTEVGSSAFLGRGLLRIRNRRLGGRAVGGKISNRLYRVSHGDEVDVHCARYFVNSSLSPVLLFRRRLKSVADVLKGIRSKGFSQSRLYVVMVRVVLFPHLIPGLIGFLLIFMASASGFLIPLEVLNAFLKQVVVSRRDVGIRKWTRWLREDLSSRPYVWLRPDFVPPSPFLVVKDPQVFSCNG